MAPAPCLVMQGRIVCLGEGGPGQGSRVAASVSQPWPGLAAQKDLGRSESGRGTAGGLWGMGG